jgi:acylphosphatase
MTDAAPDPVARRVVVRGRVQGVFFRASTRDHAHRHGVAGWVRNTPDGAVEAHLEGPSDAVDRVLAWVRAGGPRDAAVDDVAIEDVTPTGAHDFRVVR